MNSPEYDAWLAEEAIQIKALQEEHGHNAYHEGEYWPSCCSKTVLMGSLEFRFCYLMDQLNERFPGVNNPFMSYNHEGRLISALDKLLLENKILKEEHIRFNKILCEYETLVKGKTSDEYN